MKYAVVGSRSFNDYSQVERFLNQFDDIDLIVSGGAKGVDSLAEKYSLQYKIEKLIFYADWKKFGNKAGFIRNTSIIERADVVVAFWDYKSKGTLDSIKKAKKLKKELYIVDIRESKELEF